MEIKPMNVRIPICSSLRKLAAAPTISVEKNENQTVHIE